MVFDHPGSGKNTDGHGQIKGGAILFDVRRCQIDGNAPHREVVARVLDGGLDPILAFLDRPFGEADGGELGQALSDIDLHFNRVGVDTEQGSGQYFGQHGCSSCGGAVPLAARRTSFCLETTLFRDLCVNLPSCLYGVPMNASAQDFDFLDLTKNSSFPIQKRARLLLKIFD